jgi:hypothetical protein
MKFFHKTETPHPSNSHERVPSPEKLEILEQAATARMDIMLEQLQQKVAELLSKRVGTQERYIEVNLIADLTPLLGNVKALVESCIGQNLKDGTSMSMVNRLLLAVSSTLTAVGYYETFAKGNTKLGASLATGAGAVFVIKLFRDIFKEHGDALVETLLDKLEARRQPLISLDLHDQIQNIALTQVQQNA